MRERLHERASEHVSERASRASERVEWFVQSSARLTGGSRAQAAAGAAAAAGGGRRPVGGAAALPSGPYNICVYLRWGIISECLRYSWEFSARFDGARFACLMCLPG